MIKWPKELVWSYLSHIDDHVDWMSDAESITFTSSLTSGIGTKFVCLTRVGPIRLRDRMEITNWIEGSGITIRHSGIVSGSGTLSLDEIDEKHTLLTWREDLSFPAIFIAPIGPFVAKEVLGRIWKSNLKRFNERVKTDPLELNRA